MCGQTVHLHPGLQGCGWRFPEDLVNIVSSGVMGWRGPPRGDWAAMRGARESCKEGAAEPRVGEGTQHREGRTDWGLPPGSGIDLCSPRVSISTILQRLGGGQGGLERVSANLQPMPLSQTSRGLCRGPLARPRGT